jgi:hypothetical protein
MASRDYNMGNNNPQLLRSTLVPQTAKVSKTFFLVAKLSFATQVGVQTQFGHQPPRLCWAILKFIFNLAKASQCRYNNRHKLNPYPCLGGG